MATRIETTVEKDGALTLEGLPFHAGDVVVVTIQPKGEGDAARPDRPMKLRGAPVTYREPFEPAASDDWESAR